MGRYGYVKQNLRYADIRLSTVNPHCANSLLIISNIKRGDKGGIIQGLRGRNMMSGEIEKNPTEYIHELEEKIRQLESREPKLERIVEITPADYESLKRENRKLEQQIRKYRQILAVGGVSELSLLIDQYIDMSKKQLKKMR